LGGLALLVVAVLVFGGGHLFHKTIHAVVIFKGSVMGLDVGSPVTFRGVKIGTVRKIQLHIDEQRHTNWIPVYLDLDPNDVSWTNGGPPTVAVDIATAVRDGLRAQLVSESLITGLLNVDLDMRPGTPATVVGEAGGESEIPTIPSDLQTARDTLRDMDLPDLARKITSTLTAMQQTLDDIHGRVGPLADRMTTTLQTATLAVRGIQRDASRTLANVDRLALDARGQIATDGTELDVLLKSAEGTADRADKLIASLNEIASPRSPLRGDLQATLRDLAASADSLRSFTHNLERNPAGTLLGKTSQ